MTQVAIMRSRFQPVLAVHWEAIYWFFRYQREFGFPPYLVLCIIRDYDTLHQRVRICTEIMADDLRHLSIFNPLSSWDVRYTLLECLPEEYRRHIIVIEVPLKFKEMLDAIKHRGEFVVPSLDRYFQFLRNQGYLQGRQGACRKAIQCRLLTENEKRVGKWFALQTYDISPFPECEAKWFFPIVDNEDYTDWILTKGDYASDDTIIVPMFDGAGYQPESIPLVPELSTYGLYVYFNYLLFRSNLNLSKDRQKEEDEIQQIKGRMPGNGATNAVLEYYHIRAKEWCQKRANEISTQEKKMLEQTEEFARFCRGTIEVVSDASYAANIRSFFHEKYEQKESGKLTTLQRLSGEWRKTTAGSLNETVSQLSFLLTQMETKLSQGQTTLRELTLRCPDTSGIFNWQQAEDINRETIRKIQESLA